MKQKSKITSKNPSPVTIIAKSPRGGQRRRYKKLVRAVRRRELTTSLEILAEVGIGQDLAVFIIVNIQILGVMP